MPEPIAESLALPVDRQPLHEDGKHHDGIGDRHQRVTRRTGRQGECQGDGNSDTQAASGQNRHSAGIELPNEAEEANLEHNTQPSCRQHQWNGYKSG
jgi:hypothetical protein